MPIFRRLFISALAFSFWLAITSCVRADDAADARTAIANAYARYTEAYKKHDLQTIFSLMVPESWPEDFKKLSEEQRKAYFKGLAAAQARDKVLKFDTTTQKFAFYGNDATATIARKIVAIHFNGNSPSGTEVTADTVQEDDWTKRNSVWLLKGTRILSRTTKVDGVLVPSNSNSQPPNTTLSPNNTSSNGALTPNNSSSSKGNKPMPAPTHPAPQPVLEAKPTLSNPAHIYKFGVIARTGQVVDDVTIKNFALEEGFYVVLNNKGQAAFKGATSRGDAIFRYTPAKGKEKEKLEIVARVGEVRDNHQIVGVYTPSIDSQGHISYRVQYRNDGKVEADPSIEHLFDTIVARLKSEAGGKEPRNQEERDKTMAAIGEAIAEAITKRKITASIAVDKHTVQSLNNLKAEEQPFAPYYDGQDHLIVPIWKMNPAQGGFPTAPISAFVDGKRDDAYASHLKALDPQILRWFYNDKGQVLTGGFSDEWCRIADRPTVSRG